MPTPTPFREFETYTVPLAARLCQAVTRASVKSVRQVRAGPLSMQVHLTSSDLSQMASSCIPRMVSLTKQCYTTMFFVSHWKTMPLLSEFH